MQSGEVVTLLFYQARILIGLIFAQKRVMLSLIALSDTAEVGYRPNYLFSNAKVKQNVLIDSAVGTYFEERRVI